jgi:hypothetical protein
MKFAQIKIEKKRDVFSHKNIINIIYYLDFEYEKLKILKNSLKMYK